jgi:hypothetical protein
MEERGENTTMLVGTVAERYQIGKDWHTPRCFSEECANVLESAACGNTENGSVEGVEMRRVAALREFGWTSNSFEVRERGGRDASSRGSIA